MSTHAFKALEVISRPAPTADYTARSTYRLVGIALGIAGLALAVVPLIANIVAADDTAGARASTLAWSFGLTVTAFAVLKLGIAATLLGILVRLWMRVDGVKAALPSLKAHAEPDTSPRYGEIDTAFGRATATAPEPLFIHRMARKMYAPMLAMGPMLVALGLVLAIVQSNRSGDAGTFAELGAWVQGTQFLGEGLIVAGISFLLGTILASLRSGGGEVQEALGVPVKTLRMPATAKAFVGLMGLGLMTAVAQLVLYLVAAYADVDQQAWFAFLAPLREFALGTLLLGIVLALYTIGTVLGFQFGRIKELIVSGR
jgi:hypothetical protein